MEAEWLEALPRLRQQVGERNFATWIEPIRCARDENGLRLEVDTRFCQEWLTRHFMPAIRDALGHNGSAPLPVRVIVAREPVPVPASAAAAVSPRAPTLRLPKIGSLVPDYTFETFVIGHTNEVAYRAARAVADMSGRRFNPLFVWGGVGLGKTHLINALAHATLRHPPRRRVVFLAAESFMNTLITALRQDQMGAFRDRFRDIDVLILDDVEFLAGKERTQEEFYHTFNALYGAGKQIVLTSDKPPHAIARLEQRLRSRFEGGLIVDIHPPTHEMRIAIVTRKAAVQGVELPPDVADLLAQRSGPSVRELEGGLTRVLATVALRALPLTVHTVERVLLPIPAAPSVVSVERVQEVVGERFHLSVAELKSHRRGRSLAYPRQIAMYLSRIVADASFPSIAEKFGGRDHSTVMYAVRTVEQRRVDDRAIADLLSSLEREIRSGVANHAGGKP